MARRNGQLRWWLTAATLLAGLTNPANAADLTPGRICKAAVWADVGITECGEDSCESRDGGHHSFKITSQQPNEISISLLRNSDMQRYDYLCRVDGDRVVIGSVIDGKPGSRWTNPDSPDDRKKFYRVEGSDIVIVDRAPDGIDDETRYPLSSL